MSGPLRIAVLVSGQGSNLRAILAAIDAGQCAAQVVAVLADRPDAAAIAYASAHGIPTHVVSARAFAERSAWDAALSDAVCSFAPQLLVLAGFMRIIGPSLLAAFGGRIINVHPSLLPSFPGTNGPAQALTAGVKLAGCSVHVVDAGVDSGPILAQAAVPVLPGDDAASLHARIQQAEHALFPRVIHAIATGALSLTPAPAWCSLPTPPASLAWPLPAT